MIDALGAHFGPYPLDSYGSLWDNVPALGYALEVQTKSHFSSLPAGPSPSAGLTSTYLHELAHQWWGNAVTLEHWNDIWFNEGWAQLSEWMFGFESGADPDSPEQQFDDEYAAASADDWSVAPAVLDNDPALLFSTFPTYTRGGMTIEGYREIVGDAAFDDFAQGLQTEYAYDNISTEEFIAEAHDRLRLHRRPARAARRVLPAMVIRDDEAGDHTRRFLSLRTGSRSPRASLNPQGGAMETEPSEARIEDPAEDDLEEQSELVDDGGDEAVADDEAAGEDEAPTGP